MDDIRPPVLLHGCYMIGNPPEHIFNRFRGFALIIAADVTAGKDGAGIIGQFDGG